MLKLLAEDFVPETKAAADHINGWIDAQDELAPGTVAERSAGQADFDLRGVPISAMAQPYRFYLLKRVQDEFAALNDAAKADVEALLAACDMSDVLGFRLSRDIGRKDNLEVWL